MSFALIGAAALGGFSKGFGEEVLREKQRKKEEEKEYLDRYSKAAQYALTQATNDRNKRTTKVDKHKSNLSLLTQTIQNSFSVSSSEARQVAAQIYKQSPTEEAAKISAEQIKQSLNSIGSDSDNRRAAFDKLGAVVNEGEFSSLDMLAQSFAGPRPIYKDYMPAMGTFDSRTFIEKFFDGDEPRESSTVRQTKEMFANMGGKQPSDTSISIPDSDITLPQIIEIETAEKKADMHYARYLDALNKKDSKLADIEKANYIRERKRAVDEAAELSKSDGYNGHFKLRDMFAKDFERAGKANSLRFSGDHLLSEIAVGAGSERMEIGMKTALYTNYLEYIQLNDEQYKEQYFKALNAAANTVSVGKFEPSELKVQLEYAHGVRQNITTLTDYIKKLKDTDISEGAKDTTFKKFAEGMRNTGTDATSIELRKQTAINIANAFFLPNEPFYTDKIIGYFQQPKV